MNKKEIKDFYCFTERVDNIKTIIALIYCFTEVAFFLKHNNILVPHLDVYKIKPAVKYGRFYFIKQNLLLLICFVSFVSSPVFF